MDCEPVVLQAVSKTYATGPRTVHAVRETSLSVAEGEIVAIVGPSGSGKTTLLSLAGGLLSPTAGRVFILGEDLTGMSQSRRAAFRLHHVGFVFQSFNLLGALTAFENVEIAINLAGTTGRTANRRTSQLLELLDLRHRERARPASLSGGEQQRLAVARALANHPDVILADEPTASLDSRAGHRVMELMRTAVEAREARSLVVVTHDTRILDLAHRVLLLEDGRLAPPAPSAGLDKQPGSPQAPRQQDGESS
jgi:putative ABC transport system ATP-binding protein